MSDPQFPADAPEASAAKAASQDTAPLRIPRAVEAPRSQPASEPFEGWVVGVGASAGGLDALERLFTALPDDSGAAFVVVQHLSPDHKSMMDNLLARYTAMPVAVAEHEMPLRANAVFLIPPGKTMRVAGDRLLLAPKPEHGLSLPIDIFFNSLAEQCGERALAVVLSGTGSDGSRGIAAVNAAGGFVFVQDPATARFDGMPRSAIATGQVDVVAPAEDLAPRLLAHMRAPRGMALRSATGGGTPALTQPLDGILERLLAASGIDFREYKPTTVLRRIERRMQVLHAASLEDYQRRLAASPEEVSLLRRELLIPVTRFFRDAEAFEQLAEAVIPPLLLGEPTLDPIRVWVPCCATGEEAYSIAILIAEAFRRTGRSRPVKIFATDVESLYLDHAAAGQYPGTIAAEVSPRRLEQFFTERGGNFVIRTEIRQMVIFARHNLVADPPFTRMHLVTCRNGLIYFQAVAQERALQRLQYALLPGGHLFLGPSESLGVLQRDFVPLPGRHKIYRLLRREKLSVSLDPGGRHRATAARRHHLRGIVAAPVEAPPAPDPVSLGLRQLAQTYAPLTLLVGADRELLHVFGDGAGLLQFSEGQATLDVLKLLPRELGWPAALLLQTALDEGRPQTSPGLRVPAPGGDGAADAPVRWLRLVARPLQRAAGEGGATESSRGAALLSIEPLQGATLTSGAPGEVAALDVAQQRRVEALERELDLTHDSLQASIEALETANEELQATNEELMASNEELQSTNEELQSVNEELYTVNAEYQEKVDILNSVNADLESVSKAAAIPTLFVDESLVLTRFTPEATLLFKLRPGDRGRSIEDFAHSLDYPDLFTDLRRTLAAGTALDREVRSRDGQWWLARIQPYRGQAPGLARAVLTFVNVTSLKDSQRLQAVVDSLVEHVAVIDPNGQITLVNAAWRRFASANGDDNLKHSGPGRNYLDICARAAAQDEHAQRAFEGLSAVLKGEKTEFTMQYPCHSADAQRWFLMHVAPVVHPGGGAVVSHLDVSAWMDALQARKRGQFGEEAAS